MPLSEDESLTGVRVTRGALKRLGSVEREMAPSNPSTPIKGVKKLNAIPEDIISDKPLPSPKLLRTRKSIVDSPIPTSSNDKTGDNEQATPAKVLPKTPLTKENILLSNLAGTPTRRVTRRSSVSESVESIPVPQRATRVTRRSSITSEDNESMSISKSVRVITPLLEEKEEALESSINSNNSSLNRPLTRSITSSPSFAINSTELKDCKVIMENMQIKLKEDEMNASTKSNSSITSPDAEDKKYPELNVVSKSPIKRLISQAMSSTPIAANKNKTVQDDASKSLTEAVIKSPENVYSKSWTQAAVGKNNSNLFIDSFGMNKSNKSPTTEISASPKTNKSIEKKSKVIDVESSDESIDSSKFLNDEAMGVMNYESGDSMDSEDKANKILDNEAKIHDAISLGSDDTDEMDEEDEVDNDSFFTDDNDGGSLLSANSEEFLEDTKNTSGKKRRRIISVGDDSSENENDDTKKSDKSLNFEISSPDTKSLNEKSPGKINLSPHFPTTPKSNKSPTKNDGETVNETPNSSVKESKESTPRKTPVKVTSSNQKNFQIIDTSITPTKTPSKSPKSTPQPTTPNELNKSKNSAKKNDSENMTPKSKTPTLLVKDDEKNSIASSISPLNKKLRRKSLAVEYTSADENANDMLVESTPSKSKTPKKSPKSAEKLNKSVQPESDEFEPMEVDEENEEADISVANASKSSKKKNQSTDSISSPRKKQKLIRVDGSIEMEKTKIKSAPPKEVDLDHLLEKCNTLIREKKQESEMAKNMYKEKKALKKQKKLARKEQKLAEAKAAAEEAGNILPLKKKKKQKLGRLYDQDLLEARDHTAEFAQSLKVKQTMLEERLQKKKLKKQAKLLSKELLKKASSEELNQEKRSAKKKIKDNSKKEKEKELVESESEILAKRTMSVAEAYALSEHKKPETQKPVKRTKKMPQFVPEKDSNNNKENTLIAVGIKKNSSEIQISNGISNGNKEFNNNTQIVSSNVDAGSTDVVVPVKKKKSESNIEPVVEKKKKKLNILDQNGAPIKFVEQTASPKRTASGFIELPLTPEAKPKKTRYGFIEQPATPDSKAKGFTVEPVTPKSIGFKVSSILPTDQDVFTKAPKLKSKNKNNKIKNIVEPETQLPKPVFKTAAGNFVIEKLPKNIVKPSVEGSTTEFTVTTLSGVVKKQSSNPLDFKKNLLFANNIRRESPKEMLARELKKKANLI